MIIIDCYNLLHTTMPPSLAGLDERMLCRLLARAGYDRGRAMIICDGVVKPHAPESSDFDGIELVYSGPRRSADDLIVELVNADSAPRRLTVVTNDRQIQRAARRRRAKVRSCEALIQDLAAAAGGRSDAPTPSPSPKPDHVRLTDQQVQQWLDEFGLDGSTPPDWTVDELL